MYLYLFGISLITFIVYGIDKRLAILHKRRISEAMLLFLTLIGGTGGAALAMFFFRHKISKKSFLWKWVMVLLLQLMIIYVIKKGDYF